MPAWRSRGERTLVQTWLSRQIEESRNGRAKYVCIKDPSFDSPSGKGESKVHYRLGNKQLVNYSQLGTKKVSYQILSTSQHLLSQRRQQSLSSRHESSFSEAVRVSMLAACLTLASPGKCQECARTCMRKTAAYQGIIVRLKGTESRKVIPAHLEIYYQQEIRVKSTSVASCCESRRSSWCRSARLASRSLGGPAGEIFHELHLNTKKLRTLAQHDTARTAE